MEGLDNLPLPNPAGYSAYTSQEFAQIRAIPVRQATVWGRYATACVTHPDPDAFFASGSEQNDVAKLCRTYECPVMQQCGAYAIGMGDSNGVKGGMTSRERNEIARQHPQLVWKKQPAGKS